MSLFYREVLNYVNSARLIIIHALKYIKFIILKNSGRSILPKGFKIKICLSLPSRIKKLKLKNKNH